MISRDEWEKTEDAKSCYAAYDKLENEKEQLLHENPDITLNVVNSFINLFYSVGCDPNKLPENWQEIIKSKAQKQDINADSITVSGV